MTKRCAYCGQPFEPRPQVPDQAFCSCPDCQRARKRQWQREKRQSDPDYRSNQQAAQRIWTQRNQGYWRSYVFVSAAQEAELTQVLDLSNRALAFLRERRQATRSQISVECFRGKVPKARIDACLEHLLAATPPKINVQWVRRSDGAPGAPGRVYRLASA